MWVLSFLNVYGLGGRTQTAAKLESSAALVQDFRFNYGGWVYGGGGTLAFPIPLGERAPGADLGIAPFISLDFNFTRHDFDAFSTMTDVYSVTPRIGASVGKGLRQLTAYGGAGYQSISRRLGGELDGVSFEASTELMGPWNGIFGLGYRGLAPFVLSVEGGFGRRKSVLGALTLRF